MGWRGGEEVSDPLAALEPRSAHALAFEPIAERVILVAGEDDDGDKRSDRWAWDGEDWVEISGPGSVDPARSHAALGRSPLPAP